MTTAKLFQNGRSQAVRLPRAFRMAGDEVSIRKDGDKIILEPLARDWDSFFTALDGFEDNFMSEGRDQPELQKREGVFEPVYRECLCAETIMVKGYVTTNKKPRHRRSGVFIIKHKSP